MSGVGSELGSEILNETEQTAKKVGLGAADVLSNISGELKEGIPISNKIARSRINCL